MKHPLTLAGSAILLTIAGIAFLGPWLYPHDHITQNHAAVLQPPSWEHWLGTSRLGEDLLAQTMRGLQKSLLIGLAVAVLSTAVAAIVGTLAGYYGGRVDRGLMWCVDMLLILPTFLVVAVMSPVLRGQSWLLLVVVIAMFQWTLASRIVRARAMSLRERGFVRAAEYMGARGPRVIRTHLIPNMAPLLIIDCTINVGVAVIAEAGLSYFGFGVRPPDVSLGTLIGIGSNSAITYPWVFLVPVAFLITTVMAVGLIGEGLRRTIDRESDKAALV
ncbi:ABC transporter permease [Hoyosella subflava]|uniref:Oligopeptide transport system permease protein OppC n=1 Tax=Hoyosella subflava (strain DSM 45089 / JCM 17490 / NBRC 109087 / DQS3-9A1) TaxID=443218 RepID=F6EQT6_HOYSD|nr:ABC transporter permease [Hoyosella subflava]AEF39547.1 Binding-protein-dependent transport systems inner membrane component [Hoyosella subflava DQS3-9A1]